jgi:hypothetical protein
MWACSAFCVTVAFIPIHVYRATGGTFLLPAAAKNPDTESAVQVAYWTTAALLASPGPSWSTRSAPWSP